MASAASVEGAAAPTAKPRAWGVQGLGTEWVGAAGWGWEGGWRVAWQGVMAVGRAMDVCGEQKVNSGQSVGHA